MTARLARVEIIKSDVLELDAEVFRDGNGCR